MSLTNMKNNMTGSRAAEDAYLDALETLSSLSSNQRTYTGSLDMLYTNMKTVFMMESQSIAYSASFGL